MHSNITALDSNVADTFRLKYSSPRNRPRRSRWGTEVQLYSFFNLGARWGRLDNATPRPLYLRE